MWRELIQTAGVHCTFFPPATVEQIGDLETALGVSLPSELRELLLETNGVNDDEFSFIWSVRRIKEDNLNMRNSPIFAETWKPFDEMLFFADPSNGDQFSFSIMDGKITQPDIVVWDHEDDRRRWIAPSLKDLVIGWLSGALSV